MILALIWLLVVAVVTYAVVRFLAKVLPTLEGVPPWTAEAVQITGVLVVVLYAAYQTLPVLLKNAP